MLTISEAHDSATWDAFLKSQQFRPFLQSWTMGEVYADLHQKPIRLIAKNNDQVIGICFAHLVNARRGKHLSVPYGPVTNTPKAALLLLQELMKIGKHEGCSFLRVSPFWKPGTVQASIPSIPAKSSPLHLLAEHLWYLPLTENDQWASASSATSKHKTEEELMKAMRSTTRNLIRRAQKEGVTIEASKDPVRDLQHFLTLHDETRKRHGFTPYTNSFFRLQVEKFAPRKELTLYLAWYQNEVIASSIHMHIGGETSYHHGASTHRYSKIPASYLLQWTAITDALKRKDHVYNFWGIAPLGNDQKPNSKSQHPFAGVTLFKTGFGGHVLELEHCIDIPLSVTYSLTRAFEYVRKWRRGF